VLSRRQRACNKSQNDRGNDPALMPNDPNEKSCEDRGAEDDPERRFRQVAAGRQLRDVAHDDFEIAIEQGEVRAGLIGLAQR
jgi:hypothetical protein